MCHKIVLINSDGEHRGIEYNKGAEAVVISSIDILKNYFSYVDFATTMQLSEEFSQRTNCRVIKNRIVFSTKIHSFLTSMLSTGDFLRCLLWNFLKTNFKIKLNFLINTKKLREYYNANVIIHLGMDLYSSDFGTLTVFEHSKDIMLGVFLETPVVIWAESVGPFRGKLTNYMAKFTLKRVSLITLREKISKSYLDDFNIKDVPTHITADPAFILEPASEQKIKQIFIENGLFIKHRPLIGMSLAYLAGDVKNETRVRVLGFFARSLTFLLPESFSKFMLNKGKKSKIYTSSRDRYILLMAKIVDHMIDQYDCTILFIPHEEPVIGREIHEELLEKIKNKNNILLLKHDLKAQEIKGIIGQCDLFVGGKMHANIAALSQSIPTVGLSYSHKFQGIMSLYGQEKYTSLNLNFDDIVSKIDEVWKRKDEIREELKSRSFNISALAYLNGKYVKQLLNEER